MKRAFRTISLLVPALVAAEVSAFDATGMAVATGVSVAEGVKDSFIDDLFSQHLDIPHAAPVFSGTFIEETKFGDYGSTEIAEGDVKFDFETLDDFLYGTFGFSIGFHGMYLFDNPGLAALPDFLIDLHCTPVYTIRFMTGWSFRLSADPGMYSDIKSPAFGMPVTFNSYFAVCPEFSIMLGGTYRNGWDIPFIPNIGFCWEPSELFRVELACPRSRVEIFRHHFISFFGNLDWRNTTYAIDSKDGMPDEISWDEIRVSAGASLRFTGNWYMSAEIGSFLERELSADVEVDKAIDLSKEKFFRLTMQKDF